MNKHSIQISTFFGAILLICFVSACKKHDPPEPRPTPKGIIFKSWSIEGLQATDNNGNAWDSHDDSGPDISLWLHQNGHVFYESAVIPDMAPGEKHEIDIEPDIRVDSLTDFYCELFDDYEPFFGPDEIRRNYVSLIHNYLVPDSIIIDGLNPRVTLYVEYIY